MLLVRTLSDNLAINREADGKMKGKKYLQLGHSKMSSTVFLGVAVRVWVL